MREAFSSSQVSLLRKKPHYSDWFVAVHAPRTVVNLELAAIPTSHPVYDIGVIGSTASIVAGMTIKLDNITGGASEVRVRRTPKGGASRVEIMESGSGLINWFNVTTMSVLDQYKPWTKHPKYDTASSQWLIDYDEGYVAQLENYGPYVNMGPPIVIIGQSPQTASFVGEQSLLWDSSIFNYTWLFPDGQTVTSKLGSGSDPLVMTFNGASPGGSYVSLTITDVSGASHIGRRLIFFFEDESQLNRLGISEISGGLVSGGYEADISVYNNNYTTIPQGTEIVVFERSRYSSSSVEIGGNFPYRNNIIFRGFAEEESLIASPFGGGATIRARSLTFGLQRTDSYDVFLANYRTGASEWVEASSLCLDRAAIHILKNRSTVSELVDFRPMSGIGLSPITFQALPRASLYEQLRINYHDKGVLGYFGCDMQGTLFATDDPQISGGSPTNVMSIQAQDIMNDILIQDDRYDTISKADLYAIIYGGDPTGASDQPVGAQSPGDVAGYFGKPGEVSRGLQVDSQDTLITWAGNYRAKLNNQYKSVKVQLSGNTRLDPVPISFAGLTMSSANNARKLAWNNKTFIPKTLSLKYDPSWGTVTPTIEMEAKVQGIGGSAITFPTIETLPPRTPPSGPTFPELPPIVPGSGLSIVWVLGTDTLWKTTDFSSTSPTWTNVGPAQNNDRYYDFILDPWNPDNRGYLTTGSRIYRSNNLATNSPTWEAVLYTPNVLAALGHDTFLDGFPKILASINQEHYVVAFFAATTASINSGGVYCVRSEDGGDHWSYSEKIGSASGLTSRFLGAADYVPHLVNGNIVLYCAAHVQGGNERLHKSVDKGATWSTVTLGNDLGPPNFMYDPDTAQAAVAILCHTPYQNNEGGSKVFVGFYRPTTGTGDTLYTVNGGTTVSDLGATKGSFPTRTKRTGIEGWTQNSSKVHIWKADNTLWISSNGGSSFTQSSALGIVGDVFASGGFPYNQDQFYALSTSGVYVSVDNGTEFLNRTGNLPISALSRLAHGHGVIVPNWTK